MFSTQCPSHDDIAAYTAATTNATAGAGAAAAAAAGRSDSGLA